MILNGEQVLEQILEDKVIDLNNPSCNNCNECCSILTMISEEEYKFYKKYFKKNNSISFSSCNLVLFFSDVNIVSIPFLLTLYWPYSP